MNNILDIDQPWLSGIKEELNQPIKLAALKVEKHNTVKINLTMIFEQGLVDQSKSILLDGEKCIKEIPYSCKVSSTEEIHNEKDTTEKLIVKNDGYDISVRKADGQINMFDGVHND